MNSKKCKALRRIARDRTVNKKSRGYVTRHHQVFNDPNTGIYRALKKVA